MLGFFLDLDLMVFGNWEEDLRLSFVSLVLFLLEIRKYLHFSLLILYFLKYSPYDKMVLYR